MTTNLDVETVEAMAERLADTAGRGEDFRSEPGTGEWEFAPTRLAFMLDAQTAVTGGAR